MNAGFGLAWFVVKLEEVAGGEVGLFCRSEGGVDQTRVDEYNLRFRILDLIYNLCECIALAILAS